MTVWRDFFFAPITSAKQWGLILVITIMFAFAPQVSPNDWELNTNDLHAGTSIYENPSYVYPPWALILLWPYRLMTAAGSRVLSGLVVAWLTYRRGWSLSQFIVIILSPFFVFSMLFSNVDILALLFPVLLWESVQNLRWKPLIRGLAVAIMLLKPQGSILILAYWLWHERRNLREMIFTLSIAATFIMPVSLIGSPPLLLQWLDNLRHPSQANYERWLSNNVSLTDRIGFIPAALVIAVVFGGVFWFMRHRGWSLNHTFATLFLAAMLLSPYVSNQSIIVPLAFLPSWPILALQYAVVIPSSHTLYNQLDVWWTLLFAVGAIWFYRHSKLPITS
jgi:hypothetical protein